MKKKIPTLVLWLSLLLFCYGLMLGGLQLVLSDIARDFNVGVLGMGSLVGVLHIASSIAPALMGIVADRVGKKRVLVLFAFVFGLGCLLAGSAPTLSFYLVSTLLIGAGYSVCESVTSAVCVDLDEARGAGYVNLTQCLLSAGAIGSPIILSRLPAMPLAHWRLMFLFCAACFILLGLVLSRFRFPEGSRSSKAPIVAKQLWASPIFLALFVGIFLYVGLENGFGYFVELLFGEKTGGEELAAYGISAYWAGMTFSRLVYGLVVYRPRRTVRLSFLGAAICFLALIALSSGQLCIVVCALVGFTFGPIWTSLVAGAAERFPQHKASATGLMSAGCGVAGIIFPVVMGAIAETMGIQAGFLILTVSALLGALLAFALKNHKAGES